MTATSGSLLRPVNALPSGTAGAKALASIRVTSNHGNVAAIPQGSRIVGASIVGTWPVAVYPDSGHTLVSPAWGGVFVHSPSSAPSIIGNTDEALTGG